MNLYQQIKNGNIAALGKGITLVESTSPKNEKEAQSLLAKCSTNSTKSIRIGITGVPGVGKSTFIETFGRLLTSQGKKVAVLAIDPTSEKTHGSILGDKSRMNKLSNDNNAFIRPSPNSGTLGGIANRTRETITLCEAAGFEIILVETVGVGQNETTAHNLVDFFLLLMLSGAGDELQGIKRGIMELADALVITKSDGDNIEKAKNACLEYKKAIHLFPAMDNGWTPWVSTCSALENTGISEIAELINNFNQQMTTNKWKTYNRNKQEKYWLHHSIKQELGNKKYLSLVSEGKLKILEKEILQGTTIYQILNKI